MIKNFFQKTIFMARLARPQFGGFTLAEVLITLGIIGVVASITIPIIQKNVQDIEYKTAYKKAYSELSQIVEKLRMENEFVALAGDFNNTKYNFDLIKSNFKVMKSCTNSITEGCWVNSCSTDKDCWSATETSVQSSSIGFIDNSGRSWVYYSQGSVNYPLWIIVDTNGIKKPNRMGRDRFPFKINDKNNTFAGIPYKIYVESDVINPINTTCSLGNCYFKSWLLDLK